MFLYFNENRELKEIINDESLILGNSGINNIYFNFKGVARSEVASVYYYFQDKDGITYSIEEGFEYLPNQKIPFNQDRDLKFFNYVDSFDLYKLVIPDRVLNNSGDILVTIQVNTLNESYVLSPFTFYLENSSVSFNKDVNINVEQWNALIHKIDGAIIPNPNEGIDTTLSKIKIKGVVYGVQGGGEQGITNYEELENKPKINNIELSGDISLDDLGLKEIDIANSENEFDLDNTNKLPNCKAVAEYVDSHQAQSTYVIDNTFDVQGYVNTLFQSGNDNVDLTKGSLLRTTSGTDVLVDDFKIGTQILVLQDTSPNYFVSGVFTNQVRCSKSKQQQIDLTEYAKTNDLGVFATNKDISLLPSTTQWTSSNVLIPTSASVQSYVFNYVANQLENYVDLNNAQEISNKNIVDSMYNGYTLGSACSKDVTTEITSSSTNERLVGAKAVYDFVNKGTTSSVIVNNDTHLVTGSAVYNYLANWTGSSNLSKCNKGDFGLACTKGVTDLVEYNNNNLITSKGVFDYLGSTATKDYNTSVNKNGTDIPTDGAVYDFVEEYVNKSTAYADIKSGGDKLVTGGAIYQYIANKNYVTASALGQYLTASDIASSVTSGNDNPVSSGAVYTYVSNSYVNKNNDVTASISTLSLYDGYLPTVKAIKDYSLKKFTTSGFDLYAHYGTSQLSVGLGDGLEFDTATTTIKVTGGGGGSTIYNYLHRIFFTCYDTNSSVHGISFYVDIIHYSSTKITSFNQLWDYLSYNGIQTDTYGFKWINVISSATPSVDKSAQIIKLGVAKVTGGYVYNVLASFGTVAVLVSEVTQEIKMVKVENIFINDYTVYNI